MTANKIKKTTRFFAIVMATLLIALCLPLSVFGAEEGEDISDALPYTFEEGAAGEDSFEESNALVGDISEKYVEDISRREENVKHFALPDGRYTAVVYPNAVHRKDAEGEWQDINNDLALSSVSGEQKYSTSDSRVSFSSSFAPSRELMTLSENGYAVSMLLLDDSRNNLSLSAEPQSFGLASVTNSAKKELPKNDATFEEIAKVDNKSSIIYGDIIPNTDIEYILDGNAVKENIIVKAQSDEYEYSFELILEGLAATLNESGSISIKDADTGAARYKIPAPYMYDAEGNISYNVDYTLSEISDGRYLLTVSASEAWINADGRAFPVTVDPTIVADTVMTDTYVSESSPYTVYCNSPDLLVGDGYTALMNLDFPTLPEGSLLNEALLYMGYYFESSACAISVGTYQITSSWNVEDTTYDNMPSIADEALSTAMFYGDMGTENSPYIVNMPITAAAESWYYNGGNYGIALQYEEGFGIANINSYDSGYSTCEFMIVTYSLPVIDADFYCYISNSYNGRYLNRTNNIVNCKRGKAIALGMSNVRWAIIDTDDQFSTIQRIDMANYYLAPTGNNNGSGVQLYYSNSDTLPDSYKWNIEEYINGTYLIQNVSNGYYLTAVSSTSNPSSVCMRPASWVGSEISLLQQWRIVNSNDYSELSVNTSFNNITLDISETKSASINRVPTYATWANYEDFDYTVTSGSQYVTYNSDTKKFTAISSGTATVTAVHKTTGVSKTFNVKVNKNAIIIIPGILGSELYAGEDYGYFKRGMPLISTDMQEYFSSGFDFDGWKNANADYLTDTNINLIQYVNCLYDFLRCNDDGTSNRLVYTKKYKGDVSENEELAYTDSYGMLDQYYDIYDRLSDNQILSSKYSIEFFFYDWRMSNSVSANSLDTFIYTNDYDGVILIAHSMGGLVASSYLAMGSAQQNKVEGLYFLASPLLGTPEMANVLGRLDVSTLTNGEISVFWSNFIDDLLSLVTLTPNVLGDLLCSYQSVYELLPTEYYFSLANKTYMTKRDLLFFVSTLNHSESLSRLEIRHCMHFNRSLSVNAIEFHNTLFNSDGTHISQNVNSFYLYGVGFQTLQSLESFEMYNPDFHKSDYFLTKDVTTSDGDSMVPKWSAALSGIPDSDRIYKCSGISHKGILTNETVRTFIVENILGTYTYVSSDNFTRGYN